ncbi:amino acid ABC transporter permease [bacterium]|nr:amino acid ABC transporter permease [bacterium]
MDIVDTFFNTEVMIRAWPLLMQGLWITIKLGVASIFAGLVLGLLLALMRMYSVTPLKVISRIYIDVFRSIPLLVLLIVIYYALPFVGIRLSPFGSAMAALTMVSGAYASEIFRAGIQAVPKGQFEAANALGMNDFRIMTDIILPQAIRIVIPPLTNNSINVIKDTALASVVAMPDLLKQATQAQALSANPSPLILAAAIYIAILWPLVVLVTRLEHRYGGAVQSRS